MERITMKAAVQRRFGGPEVVQVEHVPAPVPKPDELLVRVHASTVSVADHRTRTRDLPKGLWFYGPIALGLFRPRRPVLGMDVAGVVVAVGDEVTGFAPGDEVIAMLGGDFGGHAEYARIPQTKAIAKKPRNLGTAAVQLAKQRGATVTAVCSGRHADLVSSLGADRVIDRTREDFTADGAQYDVIVECGGDAPFERVEHSLKAGGALLLVIADLHGMLTASRHARRSGKVVTFAGTPVSHDDMAGLARLAEEGSFRPVVDRTYDLDDVAEAHRYVDSGRKAGNVVLRIP